MKGSTKGSRIAALVVAAAAIGCGAGDRDREAVGRAGEAIQGGADDGSHAFAVGVCGGATKGCTTFCSGALLAPNLVVTARHCVAPLPDASVDCAKSTFGANVAPSEIAVTTDADMFAATHWFRAARIVTPPDASVCGGDLALVILGDNVPSSLATPATPNVSFAMADPTRSFAAQAAIGYGLDAPKDTESYGHRRVRERIAIDCVPNHPDPKLDCYRGSYWTPAYLGATEYASLGGTCEGDSGSGAFDQASLSAGQPIVLGTLSRGVVEGDSCRRSVYTRLDAWAALVLEAGKAAAQMGGYAPPAWLSATPAIEPATEVSARSDSPGSSSEAHPSSASSAGCSASRRDPSKPIPWLIGGLGAAVALRRRSKR